MLVRWAATLGGFLFVGVVAAVGTRQMTPTVAPPRLAFAELEEARLDTTDRAHPPNSPSADPTALPGGGLPSELVPRTAPATTAVPAIVTDPETEPTVATTVPVTTVAPAVVTDPETEPTVATTAPQTSSSPAAAPTMPSQPPTSADTDRTMLQVAPEDFLVRFTGSSASLSEVPGHLQCAGEQTPLQRAAQGAAGLVFEPGAVRLRTASDDALYAGGHRCELFLSQARLPRGVPVWQSFTISTSRLVGTSDKGIVMQWHDGDHTVSKLPFLAWYVQGGNLEIVARWSADAKPTNDNSSSRVVYEGPWSDDTWSQWTIRTEIAPGGSGAGLKIWRDGQLVADSPGPIGYNVTEPDYVKIGYYHWTGGNPWDASQPVRDVAISDLSIVVDPSARYGPDSIRQLSSR